MNNLFFANNETRYLEQKCPSPQKPACTPPKPPPPPPKSPKPPKSGPQKPKKKKVDFKLLKNNTCKSLNEVEYFLNNFQKFTNCIKLYKILK